MPRSSSPARRSRPRPTSEPIQRRGVVDQDAVARGCVGRPIRAGGRGAAPRPEPGNVRQRLWGHPQHARRRSAGSMLCARAKRVIIAAGPAWSRTAMDLRERISTDPAICHGQAGIRARVFRSPWCWTISPRGRARTRSSPAIRRLASTTFARRPPMPRTSRGNASSRSPTPARHEAQGRREPAARDLRPAEARRPRRDRRRRAGARRRRRCASSIGFARTSAAR